MMSSRVAILLAVTLTVGAPGLARAQATPQAAAKAAEPALSWAVGGSLMSCRSWTANKPAAMQIETLKRIAPMNWVYGYLSGKASALKLDLVGDLHPSTIGDWLDNYCGAHPADDIQKAAGVLAADLIAGPSKTRASAPLD